MWGAYIDRVVHRSRTLRCGYDCIRLRCCGRWAKTRCSRDLFAQAFELDGIEADCFELFIGHVL